MLLPTRLSICIYIAAIFAGCQAVSTCGDDMQPYGWRSHYDTIETVMNFDTINFDLRSTSFMRTAPPPTIRVFHDPSLTSTIRLEMDLETFTSSYNISSIFVQPTWVGDTLVVELRYTSQTIAPPPEHPASSSTSKKGAIEPQCSLPAEESEIKAANVFIPLGKRAKYVGR